MTQNDNLKFEYFLDVNDIYSVLSLFKNVLPTLRCNNVIREFAEKLSKNANVLVLKNNDKIVGFSSFYSNDYYTNTAYISFIAILPCCRGKSYGSILLFEIEAFSKSKGMELLKLEVNKENISAQSFYKKNGFYFDTDASVGSIYMKKKLGEYNEYN